jgi:hypothetical protein
MESPNILGNMIQLLGYRYGSNTFLIKKDITLDEVNKKYAFVTIMSSNNQELRVLSYPFFLHKREKFLDYQEERSQDVKIIHDETLLCQFVKNDMNLEEHYEYPYFFIEYSTEPIVTPVIQKLIHERSEYKNLLYQIKCEKEEHEKKIKKIQQKIKQLHHDEKVLEDELYLHYKKSAYE